VPSDHPTIPGLLILPIEKPISAFLGGNASVFKTSPREKQIRSVDLNGKQPVAISGTLFRMRISSHTHFFNSSILQNYYLEEKTRRCHCRLQSYFLMTKSWKIHYRAITKWTWRLHSLSERPLFDCLSLIADALMMVMTQISGTVTLAIYKFLIQNYFFCCAECIS